MPDYFDTTYAGAFKAGNSLGEGLNSAAGDASRAIELNKNRQLAFNTLKQAGMISTKTEQPSLEELTQGAKDFAKQQGHDLVINTGSDPEAAKKNIMGIYKALNIPMPQAKSTTVLNLTPGTKYDPVKGDVSFEASDKSPLDALIKMENLRYLQGVNKQMETGGNPDNRVYRDPVTGEEVPAETAIENMKNGQGRYVINQRVMTKAGPKESPLVTPDNLTESEKNYLITANRVKTSLDDLQNNIYPKLDKLGGNKDWEAFQAERVPFIGIKNQDIQDYKSSLNRLKSDIPFLRGGKQLTATEAKRVDILLNPFGKSDKTRQEDLDRFKKEFNMGENLMKYGQAPSMSGSTQMNQANTAEKGSQDLSTLSDEELMKIINGAK